MIGDLHNQTDLSNTAFYTNIKDEKKNTITDNLKKSKNHSPILFYPKINDWTYSKDMHRQIGNAVVLPPLAYTLGWLLVEVSGKIKNYI